MLTPAAVITMRAGGSTSRTDTGAVALFAPNVAVTVVVPIAFAVTVPLLLSTVAIRGSADDHSSDAVTDRPLESKARVVTRPWSPTTRLKAESSIVTFSRPTAAAVGSVAVGPMPSPHASSAGSATIIRH